MSKKRSHKVVPRVEDFCAVYWNDACHYDDSTPEGAELVAVVSLGVLVRLDRGIVAVAQSRCGHPGCRATYRAVLAIPRSQVTRIVVGQRNEGETRA